MNNPKQNRGRHRNSGRRSNPSRQNFDSNGPGVRIRGNATQVYEKYIQLARDAQGSGDRVMAENMLQHAEHYYRILSENAPDRNQRQQHQDNQDTGSQENRQEARQDRSEGSDAEATDEAQGSDATAADVETGEQEEQGEQQSRGRGRRNGRSNGGGNGRGNGRGRRAEKSEPSEETAAPAEQSELPDFLTGGN